MPAEPALRQPPKSSAKETPVVRSRDMATAAKMTAAVVGALALAVGLWYARTAILLAFAGILLAIVLFGASRALAELTKLPRLLMLAAAVLTVALFFAVVLATAGPTLAHQIAQLARAIAAGATTLSRGARRLPALSRADHRLAAGATTLSRGARRLPALSRADHRRDPDGAGRGRREFSSRADGGRTLRPDSVPRELSVDPVDPGARCRCRQPW